jgi:hypothetical protein
MINCHPGEDDWVFGVDADIVDYSANLIEEFTKARRRRETGSDQFHLQITKRNRYGHTQSFAEINTLGPMHARNITASADYPQSP